MTREESGEVWAKVLPALNEAQRRWYAAEKAIDLGRGGIARVQELTGISRPTLLRGIRELRSKDALPSTGRVRQPGGGRKRIETGDLTFTRALERIMEVNTAGDPMTMLRWTHKSTLAIAEEMTRQGHPASDETVRRRLREMGYTLQANLKSWEGASPAERDEQFRYINQQVKRFLGRGDPALSIDTKKKERVGNFKNAGQKWLLKGQPYQVNVYDFPDLGEGTAIPYGAYDVQRNEGFVNVGMSHDTAEFAVQSLRRWWRLFGRRHYTRSRSLLLCADGGGSNGTRNRAWKYFVQELADEIGLGITVCHYPPGTSKWNKIEHRMFSHISMNWRGQPLISYETVVNLIGATATRTGLRVRARLDRRPYLAGLKISDEQMDRLKLRRHDVHPKWNYTLAPRDHREVL